MSAFCTEADYENSIIELFESELGYTHVYGPDLETRDFTCPFYEAMLTDALYRINPAMPGDAIAGALDKLRNFENASLVQI